MLRSLTWCCIIPGLFAGLLASADVPRATPPAPHLETGEIAGAKFSIALPSQWNRRILLIAHGYVPVERPLLASLLPGQLAYRTLLDEGWMIATTSYRRNGIIVTDAIADLDALHDHLVSRYGRADRVILLGESMGGLIVTLLVERNSSEYAGAVAIGAALAIDEPGFAITPTQRPQKPLIFLTNQSELDGPTAYVAGTTATATEELKPALFRIARDGHVNVNQAERLAALRALIAWIDHGRTSHPALARNASFHDATVPPTSTASLVRMHHDRGGFAARITEVSAAYGNVVINAQSADFAAAGITPHSWFKLTAHGKSYRTFYGSNFSSVKEGEWVVFPNADGFFTLSRNYADAAGSASLRANDEVSLNPQTE